MECNAQPLELRHFSINFKIYILGYLKFNSKNIRKVVKVAEMQQLSK